MSLLRFSSGTMSVHVRATVAKSVFDFGARHRGVPTLFRLKPQASDIVIYKKHAFSGFYQTDLDATLKSSESYT